MPLFLMVGMLYGMIISMACCCYHDCTGIKQCDLSAVFVPFCLEDNVQYVQYHCLRRFHLCWGQRAADLLTVPTLWQWSSIH